MLVLQVIVTYFTVEDLMSIIMTHESRHRINRLPNGVMDTHHIYFEGLKHVIGENNTYFIEWGS